MPEAIVATRGEFTLIERAPSGRWRNLKLKRKGSHLKGNWWLAWNGERLARNRDAFLLEHYLPEVCASVTDALKLGDVLPSPSVEGGRSEISN